MIAAVAIEIEDGTLIVDNGPPDHPKKKKPIPEHIANAERRPMQAEGIVRWPPHETDATAEWLAPGSTLAIRGEGVVIGFGTVIEAREIGASADTARAINDKKPEKGEERKKPPHNNAQEPAHKQDDAID